ncbi:MAG: Ig-like domain-containing protein [Phycisphaerae bacterium]|nr:Ig-like domain-containing protein [Phycisphaerae bacterium]
MGVFIVAALSDLAMAAPRVVQTTPTSGAEDVDAATSEIVVVFDGAMKTDGYSLLQVSDGVLPEMVGDVPVTFTDERTLVIRVRLSPGTAYAFALNSDKRQGFKSVDGTPLAPTVIRFKTSGGEESTGWLRREARHPFGERPADAHDTASEKATPKRWGTPSSESEPKIPEGWTWMDDKVHGTQVAVPPGWAPRIRGGVALCVEPDDIQKASAFFVPMLLGQSVPPEELADALDEMLRRGMPDLQTRTVAKPTSDSVQRDVSGTLGDRPGAGTYRAVVSRSGMGFLMGYLGPADRIEQLRPTFHKILASYRFTGPSLRLQPVKSAAVELRIPQGWQVQTSEGDGTADQDIDWVVTCPQIPGARVFMFTPKYCTTNWVTDVSGSVVDQTQLNLWRHRGYEIANMPSDQQAMQTALDAVLPGLQITRQQSLDEIRDRNIQANAQAIQVARQTGGRYDFYMIELQGRRQVDGTELRSVAYVGATGMVTIAGMKGAMGTWSVQIRGYEAPAARFAQVATILERVSGSFCYTQWWMREVQKANEERVRNDREFWAYMNKVDREIWDNRFRTRAAINEMMYDSLLAGTPGYVNKETGTIEKIPVDRVDAFRDEDGRVVSPEELLDQKVDPRWATRVREANVDDYMNYDRRAQVWP